MRKKILSTFLLAGMVFAMMGCQTKQSNEPSNNQETSSSDAETDLANTDSADTDSINEDSADADSADSDFAFIMRKDLTSIELANLMGNGINLGNTMEAYGRTSLGTDADVSAYETFWGQPVTTKEMISGMKEAGFDSLRIPVAWTNMMDFESGDYTINQAYIDRVEEIINYALSEDMYVIINDHWDGSWWGMYGSATESVRNNARELYKSMWTQIATAYADYGDHLIFEGGNEELGYRLNDTDIAADSGTLSDEECFEVVNEINQSFVDTVRACGGNNADRFLLIPGFGTDINNTIDDRFVMPEDSAKDKLLISVHYYDPSGYCIMDSVDRWGYKAEYEYMNNQLEKMTKFTDAGYGVIIGEYGALPVDGVPKTDALAYTTNLLDNCDLYGYAPMLWDTNNGNYDKEAMLIRNSKMRALYQERNYEAINAKEDYMSELKERMAENLASAEEGFVLDESKCIAWIMYNSADWSVSYSVGDAYDPNSKTSGIVATDVEITGEGRYTVSLDFTGVNGGYAEGTVFSALAIANGETLYPDYKINIEEILINGEVYETVAEGYTASDDGKCTRMNLYNQWISQLPEDIRVTDGVTNPSPCIVNPDTLGQIKSLEITFTYGK